MQFHSFQDSRGVTVLSPDVSYNRDFTDRTAVRIKFGVDAISAASDSCARCHPDGANNGRVVLGASMVPQVRRHQADRRRRVQPGNFLRGHHGARLRITRDLNKGNTTVAGGFSYSLNQPQLHPSETTELQRSGDAYASVTQSWTKTTVTQFGYELNQVNGYQTSPFLRTIVNGTYTLGNSPDARTRHALTARIRQALPAESFLEADYRRYHDTWAVDSNAISIGVSHRISPPLLANVSYRRYDQTAAFFYAPFYVGDPQYSLGTSACFHSTRTTTPASSSSPPRTACSACRPERR